MKNILIVLQFAIATGMIVSCLVIWSQLHFTNDIDVGFDSERVVIVKTSELGSLDRINLLKERLSQSSDIKAVTISNATPLDVGQVFSGHGEEDDTLQSMSYNAVDFDYLSLYGIPLLAGRFQLPDRPADLVREVPGDGIGSSGAFVLSESAARKFGWSPQEAVGKQVAANTQDRFNIIGVVGDTITSAHDPAKSVIYAIQTPEYPSVSQSTLSVKVGDDTAAALDFVDRTWNDINPGEPIVRSFLDDDRAALYSRDNKFRDLAFFFTAIAIIICCVGLFGLASFNAANRTREVGIRKVMGSSVWQIVLLLTNDFIRLVLISNIIAWPVAYFAMNRWLENFAYRIDLTPLIFIGSGLIALCIAWVTVGGTAARAASQKPVLALRYE